MDSAYQLVGARFSKFRKDPVPARLRLLYGFLALCVGTWVLWLVNPYHRISRSTGPTQHIANLKILCLGDSLTAGVVRMHQESNHPYTTIFESVLRDALPGTQVRVDEEGLSGDLVSPKGAFMSRLETRLAASEKEPYDWVIVLGGTNDLGKTTLSSLDIFTALQHLWETASSQGLVLAMTIPELAQPTPEDLLERREEINAMIEAHQAPGFHVFDLNKSIPYLSMGAKEREEIWSDGVHLTAKGYDRLGLMVAERVLELL